MWHNFYMQNYVRFLNQYGVCIKVFLFVADTEIELGVAKKKMADSEAGLLFFVLFWFSVFLHIYFCIFSKDPQAFRSESVTSSDWVWSLRLRVQPGPVFSPDPYSEFFHWNIFFKNYLTKGEFSFDLDLIIINSEGT